MTGQRVIGYKRNYCKRCKHRVLPILEYVDKRTEKVDGYWCDDCKIRYTKGMRIVK